MPTYTAIPNTQIEPEAPITSELMTLLRDNPLAIREGDPTAPKILGLAAATNDEVEVLTVTAADTYILGVTNDVTVGNLQHNSTSYQTARTIDIVAATGTVRFYASHRILSSGQSTLRVLKNGTSVASWTTTSTSFVERSSDISVVPGDQITWEHRSGSVFDTVAVTNLYEAASNGYTNRSLLIASTDA